MGKIYVIGFGPGKREDMTFKAAKALEDSDVIIGYTVYVDLLRDEYQSKELLTTGMRQEKERCSLCISKAKEGKTVSLVCSGDAGVYGMASLLIEMAEESDCEIEVVPGVTAALSGSALLGAPLSGDFCVVSLSDNLTPWEMIERRLRAAALGDFPMAIYNPCSKSRPDHLKKALSILGEYMDENRPCGIARNIGREDEKILVCTLKELEKLDVDMFTTVFIGNSDTTIINGRLVTQRGYTRI
ncbi:MAG: precorrin-3B C(17)-methyltransferase [Butyrivibrio sp.]|nr:precorrin-3B C(17)-methyltransferase [Butyrivibrio sp.]